MENGNSPDLIELELELLAEKIRKRSSKLRFPIYVTDTLMKADLSELELSVRSLNCLHRAGYHTIGQLAEAIVCSDDLRRIRNCGSKSVSEIMTSLLRYQYLNLAESRKAGYLEKVYALSTGE